MFLKDAASHESSARPFGALGRNSMRCCHDGLISAGRVRPRFAPRRSGGHLGAVSGGRFFVFVVFRLHNISLDTLNYGRLLYLASIIATGTALANWKVDPFELS